MQHVTSGNDLIVLGLEWTVKTEDLKSYFEKFGEITSAEVSMKHSEYGLWRYFFQVKTDPNSGASRGFGFIRFKDPEVYQRVCELNHAIKGRKVEVKLVSLQRVWALLKWLYCAYTVYPLRSENWTIMTSTSIQCHTMYCTCNLSVHLLSHTHTHTTAKLTTGQGICWLSTFEAARWKRRIGDTLLGVWNTDGRLRSSWALQVLSSS